MLDTSVICTIGFPPHVHVWGSEQRAAHIKNTKMAAWKENRNCLHGKTKTEKNMWKDVKVRLLCEKKKQQPFREDGYEEL